MLASWLASRETAHTVGDDVDRGVNAAWREAPPTSGAQDRTMDTIEAGAQWFASLRPYVQGYGCDGSTDPNIHAIANRLAEQHRIAYLEIMARAYPGDLSGDSAVNGLIDEDVLAETVIPEVIDGDLALQDLQEINNYSLAMELGIELYRAGAIQVLDR